MPRVLPLKAEHKKIAILIVDDHPMLRRGLASLIESEPEFYICGEAASCNAALERLTHFQPDLAIVDLELDGSDGLELIKQMKTRYPNIPTMVLSMHDESLYAERCFRAGAKAYITKVQLDDTILVAIRCVLNGKIYMSDGFEARMADKYLAGQSADSGSPLDVLSDRELQVFRLIGQGTGTHDIAHELSLSHKTIESHRAHIKSKLGIDSAANLLRHASRWVEYRKFD